MKFEIHKKYRFEFDYSEQEYQSALDEYKKHLSSIDFENSPDLLKYFGLSFFHDGLIQSVNIDTRKSRLSFLINREDDKTDIDTYREDNGLDEIEWIVYEKNPILYSCQFEGVTSFKFDVDNLEDFYIIDTEIDVTNNKFLILMSISETKEIEIECQSVQVKLISQELIKMYTDQRTSEFPYCESCKEKLGVGSGNRNGRNGVLD